MSSIHPTAIVADGAQIGTDVTIGPYCTIGDEVKIGNGTRLISHVVVDGATTIGERCSVFPFACVGTQTQDLKFDGAATFVEIGNQTTLREYVTVNSGTTAGEVTRVGRGCHIMAYCHIAHACNVGNEVIMANCATLAGEVVVEDQVILGGMAGVHQFVRIGRLCIVGGCTKVTKDCMPFMTVDGNPARNRGVNRVGLGRRGVESDAQRHLKQAYRILCREDLATRRALDRIADEVPECEEVSHLVSFVRNSERGVIR